MVKNKHKIFIIIFALLLSMMFLVLSKRQIDIYAKTIIFGFVSSLFATIIGKKIALVSLKGIKNKWLFTGILLTYMAIPPYIHSFTWIKGFQVILNQGAIAGIFISIIVQAIYFIPLTTVIWIIYYINVPKNYFDEVKLNSNNINYMLFYLSLNEFLLIIVFVFMLSINDFTIASIFAFNTYPVELMSLFASGSSTYEILLASLPMMIIAFIITYFVITKINNIDYNITEQSRYDYYVKQNIFIKIFFLLYMVIPIVLMIIETRNIEFNRVLSIIKSDFLFSFSTSIIASVITGILAFILAYYAFRKKKFAKLIWIAIILLFTLPPTMNGIMVNKTYELIYNLFPWLEFTYYFGLQVIQVLINKSLPIAFIIFYIGFLQVDTNIFDYYKLNAFKEKKSFYLVIFNNLKMYVYVNIILVIIISLGELGGTLMVIPPGKSTLTVTIYNYLHYGSSDIVSALCLFVIGIVFVIVIFGILMYNYRKD